MRNIDSLDSKDKKFGMGAISPARKLWKLPICNWCSIFHWTLALNFKLKVINDFEWMRENFAQKQDQDEVELTTTVVCKLSDKLFLDGRYSLNLTLSNSNPYKWRNFCLYGFKDKKYSKKSPPNSRKFQNAKLESDIYWKLFTYHLYCIGYYK